MNVINLNGVVVSSGGKLLGTGVLGFTAGGPSVTVSGTLTNEGMAQLETTQTSGFFSGKLSLTDKTMAGKLLAPLSSGGQNELVVALTQ